MAAEHSPWWRGRRGEWFVLGQVVLIAALFLGPRTLKGLHAWPPPVVRVSTPAGVALMAAGACLLLAGGLRLGASLTSLPHPQPHATLVQTGPYRVVRHPMYAGGILLACGWALVAHGWLTLIYAAVLVVLLDIKSAREERWLVEKFPEYPDYQRRVPKLIPFVY